MYGNIRDQASNRKMTIYACQKRHAPEHSGTCAIDDTLWLPNQ